MATVKCALLDRERRVYLGMVEVDEKALDPAIHLPQVGECDLPAHEYRWEEIEGHPTGGNFVPLPRVQRAKAGAPTLEQALVFDLLARAKALPDPTLAWLDAAVQSFDFVPYRATPLVATYAAARGITFGAA